MIRINLLEERRSRKGAAAPMAGAPAAAGEGFQPIFIVYILILVSALGYVGVRYWMLTSEVTRLEHIQRQKEEERNRLAEIIRKAKEFEAQKELLEKKILVINDLKKRQQAPVILLDQLSRNLPDYVWFESVSESNFVISVDGWALNANKMVDFMGNLTNSGYFTNVTVPTYREEQGKVRFKLITTFRMPETAS
ncbi:PilN domain-containing protein [Acidobacteriota bacterium]